MFQSARRYLPSAAATRAARDLYISEVAERVKTAQHEVAGRYETARHGIAALSEKALQQSEEGRARLREALAEQRAAAEGRYQHFRHEVADTSMCALTGTTFNLLNGTTGPGLLALPLAFSRCGWALGTVLLVVVFAFNKASLGYLLKACLTTREHSYIGLGLRCGPRVASLVDWASLAFFFGSCVSYLVIIGDSFGQATAHLGTGAFYRGGEAHHFSGLALLLLAGFTAAVLAPLSMLRSMDSLQLTSGIAMVGILFAVGVVAVAPGVVAAPADAVAVKLSSQSLLSLPTMAFCFASQSLFPPALETLHQPATYDHMNTVVDVTMYATLGLHLAVALGGYLRFGGAVSANVLDALPPSAAVSAARGAIVLAFAFTFPMMIFLCRMHIQSILARCALAQRATDKPGADEAPREEHHALISLALVGGALLTAVLFPSIDAIFGLLGGTTAVVISFVAPAIFWEAFCGYMYKDWTHPDKLFTRALLGFSLLIAGLALPGLLIDLLGNLYTTAWWVPVSSGAGLSHWKGGLAAVGKSGGPGSDIATAAAAAASAAAGAAAAVPEVARHASRWVEERLRDAHARSKHSGAAAVAAAPAPARDAKAPPKAKPKEQAPPPAARASSAVAPKEPATKPKPKPKEPAQPAPKEPAKPAPKAKDGPSTAAKERAAKANLLSSLG